MTRYAVRGRPEQAKAAARWSCSGGIRVCAPAARCGNLWVPQGVWPIARRLQRHPRPQLKQTYSRKANPPGGSACCRMGTKLWLTTSISKGPFVPLDISPRGCAVPRLQSTTGDFHNCRFDGDGHPPSGPQSIPIPPGSSCSSASQP